MRIYREPKNVIREIGQRTGTWSQERCHSKCLGERGFYGYIELQRREGIHLKLMQDGAPGHSAADTKQDLQEIGIEAIFWPPFSPDLNPIERVWHIMKNYLQDNFPEVMSYDVLRGAVKEAWENVGRSEFEALIQSMPARCQAVIDANGLFTKY